jgi:Protein of unknown function (DUF5132)
MALFDDVLKGNVVTGLAIGIGAAVLAPVVIPVAAQILKPLAKAAIKGGIVLYEKGKETFAEMGEVAEDIIAEAKAEMASAREASPDTTAEG